MSTIDDELVKALICPDQSGRIRKDSPLKRIVQMDIVDYDTEVDMGKNRTADILLTVREEFGQHKVVIEVENDRKFDVGEILRKVKRDRLYLIVVVIPKKYKDHSYRFQKSGIPVWYWTTTCRWLCRLCNKITTSESSVTPSHCGNTGCKKRGDYALTWLGTEKTEFEEAKGNPSIDFEYQKKVGTIESPLQLQDLLLMPQWVGEFKGYVGHVKATNEGKKIVYNLTANIDVERDGIHPEILEVYLAAGGRVASKGKAIVITRKKGAARDVENTWTDPRRKVFGEVWEKLRQNDSAFVYFPETRPDAIAHFSSYTEDARLLRIVAGVPHKITVSVKGEDNEKNTVSATRTFEFMVQKEDERTGVYMP